MPSNKPNLMQYLPHFLNGEIISSIMSAIADEMGIMMHNISDMNMQILSVDTATHKLSEYERELGLQTDISQTYENRRKMIKARLRGHGTVTKNMLINTIKSFTDGDVDIVEYPEDYYFTIHFTGIPGDIKALMNILYTIKPAHLGYNIAIDIKQESGEIYVGVATLAGESVVVYPYSPKNIESRGRIYIATGNNTEVDTTTVYPRKEVR